MAWTLTLFLLLPLPSLADGIQIKTAELVLENEHYRLNAEFDVNFNATLEEALNKGVVLPFIIEFELTRPRFYWLDEEIATAQQTLKLSYNALTRRYQLSAGPLHKTFSTLADARAEMGSIEDWQVVEQSQLKKKYAYHAALRIKLDVSHLPKPLQVSALSSKDWSLASDWHRWNVTP